MVMVKRGNAGFSFVYEYADMNQHTVFHVDDEVI
jgi:hypothetical protein